MGQCIQDLRQVRLHTGNVARVDSCLELVGTVLDSKSWHGIERSDDDTNPSGKHILIVDDYADALDIWAIYLKITGLSRLDGRRWPDGAAKAEQLLPDSIVLDLELPGLTGFEVASGSGQPRDERHPADRGHRLLARAPAGPCAECGFDAVVVKPCDPDMLVQEIERLLACEPVGEPARAIGCGTSPQQ